MAELFPWSHTPVRADASLEYAAARRDMEHKRFVSAAERLEWILQQPLDHRHGLSDVRELLARSYFHSARLEKAEQTARAILSDNPSDGWTALLLARTLQRQGRHDEAKGPAALAAALGHTG